MLYLSIIQQTLRIMNFNSTTVKDTRGAEKRDSLKREKWDRQIKKVAIAGDLLPPPKSVKVQGPLQEYDQDEFAIKQNPEIPIERGRRTANAIANHGHYRARNRSESPPPKSKRGGKGTNKGHANACPYCRPEICKRMEKEAATKQYVRDFLVNQAEYMNEDQEDLYVFDTPCPPHADLGYLPAQEA